MLYYEGLTCPVCQKRFEVGEDIVACPHCGLPHHRACWQINNRCQQEEQHGTDQQWSREKAVAAATKGYIPPDGLPKNDRICPHCFTKNAEFAEFCTHCGHSLGSTEWHSAEAYIPFTPPVSSPVDVEEQALSAYVGVNTQYYIPRFRNIREGRSGGWNWAGFLLGPLWLFYRKQYALGGVLFLFQTILDIATMWLMHPINMASTEAEFLSAMEQLTHNPMTIPAACLSLLLMIVSFLLGAKGNQLYMYHCTRKIHKARQETPDLSAVELGSFGGVSVGVTVAFYLLSSILVNGIAAYLIM